MKLPKRSGRMQCMQIATDVYRWPDDMLGRFIKGDLSEAREELKRLEANGQEVLDCGRHRCDEKGRCTGEPILRLKRDAVQTSRSGASQA